jgi:hypothetical protein
MSGPAAPAANPRFSPPEFVAMAVALCLLIAIVGFSTVRPWSDFIAQYAAAQLVGSSDLYHYGAVRNIEESLEGPSPSAKPFVRPPFYAAALWPLGKLSYTRALQVWQTVNLTAFALFLMLWARDPWKAAGFCLWFVPTADTIMLGQDMFLVLLCVAGAYLCWTRGWHFAAGLLLSLCCVKAHLFLLLPVLIVARRLWSTLAGLGVGGAALLLVSCLVAGWNWIGEYLEALRQATAAIGSEVQMANLVGLLANVPSIEWMRIPAILGVVGFVWFASRRGPLDLALGLTLAGGLVVSPRAFLYDAAILAPLLIRLAELGCQSYLTFVAAGFGLAHLLFPWLPIIGQIWVVAIFVAAGVSTTVLSQATRPLASHG